MKQAIKATLLCVAFAQSAQAGGVMPELADDITPETAYGALANDGSCLLASEALNPNIMGLTEDQQTISNIAREVSSTDLGLSIIQKNASDDVFYCFWNDEKRNGIYYWDLNVANISDNGISDITSYVHTAVEEFAHAAQYHTDNNLINKLDDANLYGKYLIGMMVEAQAKIWKEQILYKYRENNNVPHPEHSGDIYNSTTEGAHQCFMQYNGAINQDCLLNAFNGMLINDNAYTDYTLKSIMNGDFGPIGEHDVCNLSAQQSFGYIPSENGDVYFLPTDYDIEGVIDTFRSQEPNRSQFKSWQYPTILQYKDSSVDIDSNGKPVVKSSYTPSCLPT